MHKNAMNTGGNCKSFLGMSETFLSQVISNIQLLKYNVLTRKEFNIVDVFG